MPTSESPPGASVEDLRSLTLILSTQRSGSTLLCRDIESLGGLGRPREHFSGVNTGRREAPLSEMDVLEGLLQGVDKVTQGATGLKLQVGQVTMVAEALAGGRQSTPEQAMATVISWAQDRFERVLLVILVRNAIDIAISRVIARATGTYTSRNPRGLQAGAPLPDIVGINQRILHWFEKALMDLRDLNAIATEYSDLALMLTYNDLAGQVEQTTHRLLAHARKHGLEPRGETVTRRLEKVISTEESARVREGFLDYLRTGSGIVPHYPVDAVWRDAGAENGS